MLLERTLVSRAIPIANPPCNSCLPLRLSEAAVGGFLIIVSRIVSKIEVRSANLKAEELLITDDEKLTAEECDTLRCAANKIPWSVYLICVVEMAERFTCYSISGPSMSEIRLSDSVRAFL
jgi:hypothetical protein